VARALRRALKPALFALCLVPMVLVWTDLALGRIHGEWIKEITHRTGFWGISFITLTLSITPLRRLTGWNALVGYRRMLGLFGFFYIVVHFLIYLVLDQFFDWHTIVKDVGKRPYITVGFTGLTLMIPLAVTSTRGWIRRLGKRWTQLHSLIYAVALAGVVHFMWSQKADRLLPIRYALILAVLLALRLVPRAALAWKPRWLGSGASSLSASPSPPAAQPS
jgi:sulfoxide reductase heme-binding subunit YedZ